MQKVELEMITATKLLDRVLWNQYYMVPNWYINTHRIAYYNKFEMPNKLPLYYQPTNYVLQTWSKMTIYIIKRILLMIPTLLGILFFTFLIIQFVQGSC